MKQTLSTTGSRRGVMAALGAVLLLALFLPTLHAGEPVTLADKPLHYTLKEGETTVVVRVPDPALLEKFALVNENAAARGQLKIAVADSCLPADDPKWVNVSGDVAFVHKRLFHLSLVGVEAKFVKLSFRVEKAQQIAATNL